MLVIFVDHHLLRAVEVNDETFRLTFCATYRLALCVLEGYVVRVSERQLAAQDVDRPVLARSGTMVATSSIGDFHVSR